MHQSGNGFCTIGLSFLLRAWSSGEDRCADIACGNAFAIGDSGCVFVRRHSSELKQLQQAALGSDYAYRQVAHLANNIGPRLSGSAQAAKAVEYVAGELKAIGCNVQLEKVMVPHWVRGEETAALVQFPGQAPNTTQKIVLCALGGSVADTCKRN